MKKIVLISLFALMLIGCGMEAPNVEINIPPSQPKPVEASTAADNYGIEFLRGSLI